MNQKSATLTVSRAQFGNNVGVYFERAAEEPVVITEDGLPVRVLIDIGEDERLKQLDTRDALYAHELSEEEIEQLKSAAMNLEHEHLDRLMD